MTYERTIAIGARRLALGEFLAACARSLAPPSPAAPGHGTDLPDAAFVAARDALLAAGLPAIRAVQADLTWVQLNLTPAAGRSRAVYPHLLRAAEELLDRGATNFFYMHKPPGLRIRFEVPGGSRTALYALLTGFAERWHRDGLITSATPACYEPEAHLFGGPVSMRSVHRLFTADALAWLGYHSLAGGPSGPGPAWAFSMAVLRNVFDAMGVVGWEDRDVWDLIRRYTGRRLSANGLAVPGIADAGADLRRLWAAPAGLRAQLSADADALVERYTAAAHAGAATWHTAYFGTPEAYVGPREVTAYYVVYHWNRGGLSMGRQALLAESLALPLEVAS